MTLQKPPIATDRTAPSADPTTRSANGRVPLSVVIIAENEESRIEDCIESVFAACRTVPAFEVILVDSASTDRTVDRALDYDITVLRIPDEHTVSCGAGRYVGDQVASGELVLHVDGDMTLTETWLPRAIEYLRENDDAAAVEGCLDESTHDDVREVDKVGGVMLYDADALAAVGGFDPYLLGYEDIDVGFELKTAGYRLVQLPEVSAIHHDGDESVSEPLRRWRQGYYVAPGQTIRKHRASPPILGRLVRRQRYKIGLMAWLGIGAVSLLATPLLLVWALLSAVGFGVVASKRGVGGAVGFFVVKSFGVVGLLAGMSRETPPAESFPLSAVEVVATGQTFAGTASDGPSGQ
jgi:GT2 family glycosyltransferase